MSESKWRFTTTLNVSDTAMRKHLDEAEKYREFIREASSKFGFQESVIGGIGSRESGWGLFLKPHGPKGTGDFAPRLKIRKHRVSETPLDKFGFGRGLMQIDYDYHEFARTGDWANPYHNIQYGIKLLHDYRLVIIRRTKLQDLKLLRATLASYNAGPGNVFRAIKNDMDIDSVTTGKDYSRDVLNRAGYFQIHGWK